MARNHKAGGQGEPHAARMGELLPSGHRQQGVSGTRQLHRDAVAPVWLQFYRPHIGGALSAGNLVQWTGRNDCEENGMPHLVRRIWTFLSEWWRDATRSLNARTAAAG